MIGSDNRATVERAEVRSDVNQGKLRVKVIGRECNSAMQGGRDSESLGYTFETIGPLRAEFVLHASKPKVSRNKREITRDVFKVRRLNVTSALLQQRCDRRDDGLAISWIIPEFSKTFFGKEHRGEVRLRVEIECDGAHAEF